MGSFLQPLSRRLLAFLAGQKNKIGILLGLIIGTLIGRYAGTNPPEVVVSISAIIVAPFFLLDARFDIFGKETLFLSTAALGGAVIGVITNAPNLDDTILNAFRNALGGTALSVVAVQLANWFSRTILGERS